MRALLSSVGLITSFAAGWCNRQGTPPAAPCPAPEAPPQRVPASPTASTPPPPPSVPGSRLRARGAQHGTPVYVPANENRTARWLVFLGTDEEARAAWLVDENGDGVPVGAWPPGVRVLGGTVRGRFAYLWVETLEAIGQRSGIRAPLIVSIDGAPRREVEEREATLLAGAVTLEEMKAGVALLPRDGDCCLRADRDEIRELVTRASFSTAALRAAISRRGLEIGRRLPTDIVAAVAHVERDDVGSSPYKARLEALVAAAVRAQSLPSLSWGIQGVNFGGNLLFVREGVSWVLRGMVDKDWSNPWDERARRGYQTNLSLEGDTSLTERILRESVSGRVVSVLGQAQFVQGDYTPESNAIGAAVVEDHGCQRVVMAFFLHGRSWVDPLPSEWHGEAATAPEACARASDTERSVHFADFDADGLADVLLWERRGRRETRARVFLAPREVVGWGNWSMQADEATQPSLRGARDLQAAFTSAWQTLAPRH